MTQPRQPQGIPTGGQWATGQRGEHDGTGVLEAKSVRDALADSPPRPLDWMTALETDGLSDETAAMLLRGEYQDALIYVEESYNGEDYENALAEARDWASVQGYDWDELDESDQDAIVEAVREQTDGSPLDRELIDDHTRLMRASLATLGELDPDGSLYSERDEDVPERRIEAVRKALVAKGLEDTPELRKACEQLVAEGPMYWDETTKLDLMVADRVRNVMPESGIVGARTAVDIESPHILLTNQNGEGTTVRVAGTIRVDQGQSDGHTMSGTTFRLDTQEYGYGSWTRTADPHLPAFYPDWSERKVWPHPNQEAGDNNARILAYISGHDDVESAVDAAVAENTPQARAAAARTVVDRMGGGISARHIVSGLYAHRNDGEVAEAVMWRDEANARQGKAADPRDSTMQTNYEAIYGTPAPDVMTAWRGFADDKLARLA